MRRKSLPFGKIQPKMFATFFSTTKLNRFIQGLLKMGRKSHQFGILFGIYLQFLVSHFECDFFGIVLYRQRQRQQQQQRRRQRRPRLHFNSYFCGWLHPEKKRR